MLLLVAGVAAWSLRDQPNSGPLKASGTIELDEVTLAAETSGRIAELNVDEGSSVLEGQIVGHLTDPVLDVQIKQVTGDPAQQQIVQAEMSRLELRAPLGGVVLKRLAHRGEVVAAGTPILTVADPTDLKLTLYVLEADMGRVHVGQHVGVHADAFPDRTFAGHVETLATRAEFTPRNVQSIDERRHQVFGIKVRVTDPAAGGVLKSGMAATVYVPTM